MPSGRRKFTSPICWHKPVNLEAWFPERPYFNSPNYGHDLEAYYTARDKAWKDLEQYDALVMPGGSGPMIDINNNLRIHDLILGFVQAGQAGRGGMLLRDGARLRP